MCFATQPWVASVEEGLFENAAEEVEGLSKDDLILKDEPQEVLEASDSSSSSGSEADRLEKEALEDTLDYQSIEMVTGSAESSYIHTVDKSKVVREGSVGTGCNARPRQDTAKFGSASFLRSLNRRFCPNCTAKWPLEVIRKLNE